MENDADCMTVPRADAAHPVPEIDAVHAAGALHRAVPDGEHHRITLPERHDFRPRLHAWTLLGQDELATRKVAVGFGQQNGDLEWKNMLAVEVLMQAVVVVLPVLKQQRCRPELARVMATREEVRVSFRVANVDP